MENKHLATKATNNNIVLKVAIISALIFYAFWTNRQQKKRKELNENLLDVDYNY